MTPSADTATRAAREALARWLGPAGSPAAISVRSVERVTWRNGCLELSRAGRACTQALVDGYRVLLGLGNATYEVRTDATARTVLWAPSVQILLRFAEASTNLISFVTDDGRTLVAQPVPGTDFGVSPTSFNRGDPAGIGLADNPGTGPMLLVFLDSGG